ncbi:MAG TPA: hypothetical protein VMG58_03840 [Candidatus Sulfotelmatobacter sp.]|nr:hypothetical protein [Candidatus Sulfotelmatobacter sp.]
MLPRLTLICAFIGGTAVRADDSFTKGLTPSDFQAAGLGKLTPEELARLDGLVRARQSGTVAKVKEETTKAVTEDVRRQVQAEDRKAAQKQAASAGLVDRMKVLLRPGTEIEYATLDAALAYPFYGWRKGTVFTLTNGQRWVVTDEDRYWAPAPGKTVHVRIIPGALGSFFMDIEDGGRPRVKFLGNTAVPQAPQSQAQR